MNRRLLTVLLIAFVIAGACTWMIYRVVGSRIVAQKPIPTTRVVAASSDLKLGTLIAASDLTTVSMAGGAPKGSFTDPKDVIGRGVTAPMVQGEAILDSRLAPKGSGGGLAATIPEGMRACAVKVDEVVGVAGFVTPGMHVDVLVSGNPPGGDGGAGVETTTILQNIAVLSAGTDIQKDAEGKPQQVQVVNLLVTPDQAQKLSLASNQLKIQLVLRNPLDNKIATINSTGANSLFTNAAAPAAGSPARVAKKKPAPELYSIVITNGTATSVEKFPGGQN